MTTPEERRRKRDEDTLKQREKRKEVRICGNCGEPTKELVSWLGRIRPGIGRVKPLMLPICVSCFAKLTGQWSLIEDGGPGCPIFVQRASDGEIQWVRRPCTDCISREAAMAEAATVPGWKKFLRGLF